MVGTHHDRCRPPHSEQRPFQLGEADVHRVLAGQPRGAVQRANSSGPNDGAAKTPSSMLAHIRRVYADREVATVRSEVLFRAGGGGPHCITQQVPVGTFAP